MRIGNEVHGRVFAIWLQSYDSRLCFLPQEMKNLHRYVILMLELSIRRGSLFINMSG